MLGRLNRDAAVVFDAALDALANCADVAATAGCSTARTYVAGAAGSLRHALDALALDHPSIADGDPSTFETKRVGASTLIGSAEVVDTISGCRLPGGDIGTVRALLPTADPARGVWLRHDIAMAGLHVRGRVVLSAGGYRFEDAECREPVPVPRSADDLIRDLVIAVPFDLARRPGLAAALEITLATGSWVHLRSGARWYADPASARAAVRLLNGRPGVDTGLTRFGVCVDREVLLVIEALGWRQWPTP